MVKDALFYTQQKGSLASQLLCHGALGRAPAAVGNHGNPQGSGAQGWVIHQKMPFTDLDYAHHCSSAFVCLIKS